MIFDDSKHREFWGIIGKVGCKVFKPARYPDLRMERGKSGKITIMPPLKFGSGNRESIALIYLGVRSKKAMQCHQKIGLYSSKVGFQTSTQAPNEEDFLSVMQDFIVEVHSQTGRLAKLKKKMKNTWIKNGVRLAWLIDPYEEKAYIYRANGEVETVRGFSGKRLAGEDVMPGMELPLEELRIQK